MAKITKKLSRHFLFSGLVWCYCFSSLTFLFDIKAFACLSMHVFEPRTNTGSVLFSYFTCLYTNTFTFFNLFALVKTIGLKIAERPMSWPAKCSLPVAVPAWLKNVACLSSLYSSEDTLWPLHAVFLATSDGKVNRKEEGTLDVDYIGMCGPKG